MKGTVRFLDDWHNSLPCYIAAQDESIRFIERTRIYEFLEANFGSVDIRGEIEAHLRQDGHVRV
jgi:hypothetical protein